MEQHAFPPTTLTILPTMSTGSGTGRSIKPGVYAPICSFFQTGTEDLGVCIRRDALLSTHIDTSFTTDLASFEQHVVRAAKAGVGILIAGSNGEAIHLTHAERTTLIKAARVALDNANFTDVPIIAGTGAGSARETIELCEEAAAAGADVVIVITSGYFAGALAGNAQALKTWYVQVANKSPLPVLLYNCEHDDSEDSPLYTNPP